MFSPKHSRDSRYSKRSLRCRVEILERRELLAAIIDPSPNGWWEDSFVVRRDEIKPVEISLSGWTEKPISLSGLSVSASSGHVSIDPSSLTKERPANNPTFNLLYQPDVGFTGIDRITFAWDQAILGTTGDAVSPESLPDVAINVVDPWYAVPDWYQVEVNSGFTSLDVLANDIKNANYLGEQPQLAIQSVWFNDDLVGGDVRVVEDQSKILYQPADDFQGVRTISYLAIDEQGYEVVGSTSVRVSNQTSEIAWPEQLQAYAVQQAVLQNQYQFGSPLHSPYDYRLRFDVALDAGATEADASNTNNQVAGIEESDRVKTDGDYLYILTTQEQESWFGWDIFPRLSSTFAEPIDAVSGNLLTIVDVRQSDFPTIVARQTFDDPVTSLDLHGHRLTVITERYQQTVLNVMDVSVPASPQRVWTTAIDGDYVESRRVADILYVFTENYGFVLPPIQSRSTQDKEFGFYQTASEYFEQHSADELIESLFPSQKVYDSAGNPREDLPVFPGDPHEIYTDYLDTWSRSHHVSFDLMSNDGSFVDWHWEQRVDHRLVTSESIYTTRTDYDPRVFSGGSWDAFSLIPESSAINTEITHYSLDGSGFFSQSARGVVPGTLNNRFSIDEYEGRLRVATENAWWTRGDETTPPPGSNLYVLQQADDMLALVGGVEGLAPGEQIYSVRFAKERGYIVTFRQVDPLFVIDLSEPTLPVVTGQLKIPGYSQYLQVLDDQTLLGIGRDADETTGQYDAMVISLFDVADPSDPQLMDRYEFDGGRSTFSPYSGGSPRDVRDHHAISYFANEQILAIPIYSEPFGFWDPTEPPIFDDPNQSEMRTFRIDRETGIQPIDAVAFETHVDRSVRIESLLYSISNRELKVSALYQSSPLIANLKFESDGQDDYFDILSGEETIADLTSNDVVDGIGLHLLKAELLEGHAEIYITKDQRLHFRPLDASLAPSRIRYLAQDAQGTLIEAYATIDPDLVWQNAIERYDVNQDGETTARDVLNIINLISIHGAVDCEAIEALMETASSIESRLLFDTSGDRRLSAIDALQVINQLQQADRPEGESRDDRIPLLRWEEIGLGSDARQSEFIESEASFSDLNKVASFATESVDAFFSNQESFVESSIRDELSLDAGRTEGLSDKIAGQLEMI